MSQKQDYYETLGLKRDADDGEIKKSYRRLAMKYHPDRNPNDKEAEKKFKAINEAYSILSDSEKRSMYDQYGHAGFENGGGGPGADGFGFGADISDIFEQFMRGSNPFGGQQTRETRGHDLSYSLQISLEEAIKGVTKTIKFQAQGACETCHGKGAENETDIITCDTCHGNGQVRIQQGFISLQQPCPSCHGQGKTVKNPCKSCRGKGHTLKHKTIEVKIPQGIDDGNRIRMSGEGEYAGPGSIAGDLYVEVHLKKHDIFLRKGNDLYCEVPIEFTDAALGGEVIVPTIDGKISIKIPAETQTGAQFRLRGKGVKGLKRSTPGDLICKVFIETPTRLNDTQKDLLKQFQTTLEKEGNRHTQKRQKWLDKVKGFLEKLGLS